MSRSWVIAVADSFWAAVLGYYGVTHAVSNNQDVNQIMTGRGEALRARLNR